MHYQTVIRTEIDLHFKICFIEEYGANFSREQFAAVYGNLATEYLNRETKVTADPFTQVHSVNITATNRWVSTIHIHAKLIMAIHDKINIKTTSTSRS